MPFDPTLPANNSPIVSAELRNQFNGLQTNISAKANESDCTTRLTTTALNPLSVFALGLTVSNPPTQAEVQSIASKVDELIGALKRFTPGPPP